MPARHVSLGGEGGHDTDGAEHAHVGSMKIPQVHSMLSPVGAT